MQFIDLETQFKRLEGALQPAIQSVLARGQYVMGPEVSQLERRLADFCGVAHCIACANGTDALVLALRALDIGPGDAVATTAFSFFATAEAIMLVGARPIFVDIELESFNLDPDDLVQRIERHQRSTGEPLKAVIAVDLFGRPADYPKIENVCQKYGLLLIEDAAQGLGASMAGRRTGSFGTIATTSFFPAKPLGCYGDGGALFTDDDLLAERLRSLRVHGKGSDKYENVEVGTNSRLDTIQAAILLAKLDIFPEELERRQAVANRYSAGLSPSVSPPSLPTGVTSSWAQFSILAASVSGREEFMRRLSDEDISSAIYYRIPLHQQPAVTKRFGPQPPCPVSEDASARIFSLPMHPYLNKHDQDRIISAVNSSLSAS